MIGANLTGRKHPTLSSYNESKLIQELSNLKGLDIEEGMLFFSGKKEAYFRGVASILRKL